MTNICKYFKSSEFILFADDTNIFIQAPSKQQVYNRANKILKLVSTYMKYNKLHINFDKSCFMYFRKSGQQSLYNEKKLPPIMIGDKKNKPVSETKFLGVIIDEKLSWDAHIKSLSRKLASCVGSISRISKNIPENLMQDLYHTLFESYLSYCITVWGGISDAKLTKLSVLQKRVLRILFGDREKYLDKFKTSVRTRPFPNQVLTSKFYEKEHTKPIFNEKKSLM